jgi:hypothetical protein
MLNSDTVCYISLLIVRRNSRRAYSLLMKLEVVRFVQDHVVKVVQRSFPLKGKLMKCVETVKCKDGPRPIEGGREPARA